MKCKAVGPSNAKILIVGEFATSDDLVKGTPFNGSAGKLLTRVLADLGVSRDSVRLTNVCQYQAPRNDPKKLFLKFTKKTKLPSDRLAEGLRELKEEVANLKPDLIICLGGLAMWAFTGEFEITKWRGSQLWHEYEGGTCCLLPTYSPGVVLRKYSWLNILQMDLRRALTYRSWKKPVYNLTIAPSYLTVMTLLDGFLTRANKGESIKLAGDYETRAGHIACLGLAWSRRDAICIPFMKKDSPSGYWTEEQEFTIVKYLRQLFLHPNVKMVFQNVAYDIQYSVRSWLLFFPCHMDTMVAHHVCWPGMKKSLDFLASMYCEFYQYWKDDGKHFDLEHHDESRLWEYNAMDCTYTYEISDELEDLIPKLGLEGPNDFQHKQIVMTTRMMIRGVKRDADYQSSLFWSLSSAAEKYQLWLDSIIEHPVNIRSPKQLSDLFYTELGQQRVFNKEGGLTTNEVAMLKIAKRTPILQPVVNAILDMRSIGVYSSTFVGMRTDIDGRLRCSYSVAGTDTYRYASSQNAFGSGGNLQNIPGEKEAEINRFALPNIRKMFIPDQGYIIGDADLDRADAQVVAWEADDEILKIVFREGLDLHLANARDVFNLPFSIDDLRDPKLLEKIAKRYKHERRMAKMFVHGTNYGGSARTMAMHCKISIREAEEGQRIWFTNHPGIKEWQHRIEMQLQLERSVSNKFGYRIQYFDRPDTLLPEALAWIPQSTVALVIDKGMYEVDTTLPQVELLMQVHDSIVFQCKKELWLPDTVARLQSCLEVVVPYDDPLIIGTGLKISDKNWGDCEEVAWEKAAYSMVS